MCTVFVYTCFQLLCVICYNVHIILRYLQHQLIQDEGGSDEDSAGAGGPQSDTLSNGDYASDNEETPPPSAQKQAAAPKFAGLSIPYSPGGRRGSLVTQTL